MAALFQLCVKLGPVALTGFDDLGQKCFPARGFSKLSGHYNKDYLVRTYADTYLKSC